MHKVFRLFHEANDLDSLNAIPKYVTTPYIRIRLYSDLYYVTEWFELTSHEREYTLPLPTVPMSLDVRVHVLGSLKHRVLEEGTEYLMVGSHCVFAKSLNDILKEEGITDSIQISGKIDSWEDDFRRKHIQGV